MESQAPPGQAPQEIRAVTINFTPEVGSDDVLIAAPVVPDGREGNTVFARTLRPDESGDGIPVVVNPAAGEQLAFRPGSLLISIRDIDRHSKPGPTGYAPITNTLWTWLMIGEPARPDLFRYLLAAARRLDGTHDLLVQIYETMANGSKGFIGRRAQWFRAVSIAEILAVALGRSIDLLDGLPRHFSITLSLPPVIEAKKRAIREIRNAFEHIEDRALGQVHRKPHPDALTVFDQREFITQGVLRYGTHALDMRTELPQILLLARTFIYNVAVSVAGPARQVDAEMRFFAPQAPNGPTPDIDEKKARA